MSPRVEGRAEVIYTFLRKNLGQGYRLDELLAETGFENSATTRRAIRRVAQLAAQDGLTLPPAGPKTNNRYMVTDSAQVTFEPTLNLRRIKQGVGNRERMGLDFMQAHSGDLSPGYAAAVNLLIASEDSINSMNAAIHTAIEALRSGDGAPV